MPFPSFITRLFSGFSQSRAPGQPVPIKVLQLERIQQLPIGLDVVHAPTVVHARANGASGCAYTWEFQTCVTAIRERLTVTEFGAFIDRGDGWVFGTTTGKPFTGKDFAQWYNCPDALLEPGRIAIDTIDWVGTHRLYTGRMLCYYIAQNHIGQRYRGESIVELSDKPSRPSRPLETKL